MNDSGVIDQQWKDDLYHSLDAAVDAVRRQEPRSTDEMARTTVRQMAHSAIATWRDDEAVVTGPLNQQWKASTHDSLDERVIAIRKLSPETEESTCVSLVRQGAQTALDEWHPAA